MERKEKEAEFLLRQAEDEVRWREKEDNDLRKLHEYKNRMEAELRRTINIAEINDKIVIGDRIFCSSDYRAIDFKISIDRLS